MLTPQAIAATAQRIAAAASNPARVIVFGSYARGDANEDSDLDLLVVEQQIVDPTGEYLRLREAAGSIGVGVDLLLISEPEFNKRRHWWTTPVYWAEREGKVLHEPA
ncbi:nucleotidyltransferase domain-containing protein [Propionivibrio sp.]|uniref:nucleotidyltransferase domain-containing protein n=1 Tax=Propionivibrio sp. TaxID=2212460 RepID=UPI003BF0DA77